MKASGSSYLPLIVFLLSPCQPLSAASLHIGTASSGNWTVTGAGAVNVSPFVVTNEVFPGEGLPGFITTGLSLTSTATSNGVFVTGASIENFTGFWMADYRFFLPSDASSITLVYSNLYADDRAVLTLNGTPVDSAGILKGTNGPDGNIVLSDGGPVLPYTFNWTNGSISGVVTSGFIPGGFNTLEAIVNNTHSGIYGTNAGFGLASGDQTIFAVAGAISFSPVPEPGTLTVLAATGALLVARRFLNRGSRRADHHPAA